MNAIRITAVIIAALALAAFSMMNNPPAEPDSCENKICLQIQLDLNEDIGLFLIDSDINGQKTNGGISNADKTMLNRNELLYWSFDQQFYQNVIDPVDLTLFFRIVTEYCDPNYENRYPEEYVIPLEEITFPAVFGQTYRLTVIGDKENGYQVIIE